MKPLRPLAFAAALVLAACTSSPTDTPSLDPAAPSFDGGINTLGSGNYTGEDGPGMTGSGNDVSSDTTTAGGQGSTRGTNLIGSGT